MSLKEKCAFCKTNGLVSNCSSCMVNLKKMEDRINKWAEAKKKIKEGE